MGSVMPEIDAKLTEWLAAQDLLVVASVSADPTFPASIAAQSSADALRVVGPQEVELLLDPDESVEVLAGIASDPRVCVMCAAFTGPPRIVRLHGHATVSGEGVRVRVERISESCGFVVPRMASVDPVVAPVHRASVVGSQLGDEQRQWIEDQHLYFTATATGVPGSRVNVSPKGVMETMSVTRDRVRYLDFFGSGIETVAHVNHDRRVLIFVCGLMGDRRIVRVYCRGRVVQRDESEYVELRALFDIPEHMRTSERCIFDLEIEEVEDSRAPLPVLRYEDERQQLFKYAATQIKKLGPEALIRHSEVNNLRSIDGLPALRPTNRERSDADRAALNHEGKKL
jgi:hypothetical protein